MFVSLVYENVNNEVCVELCKNDYVKISTDKKDVWLKVTNVDGILCVDNVEENIFPKESKWGGILMELLIGIVILVVWLIFKDFGNNSSINNKNGLSDIEKFNIYNDFNKK